MDEQDRSGRRGAPPAVRRITDPDAIAPVVATLVESHADYVWEAWALPWDDRPDRLARLYDADLRRFALPQGEIWATDGYASVAVWLDVGSTAAPGTPAVPGAAANQVEAEVFGERRSAIDEVGAIVERVGTPPARWYLATMGTRVAHRRRGLGTDVLAPRLRALDLAGDGARLETSDPSNLDFYGRLGFDVVAELTDLPHGAPATWVMHRRPRSVRRRSS